MRADALELKAIAERVLREPIDPATPESERDLVVTAHELLSLIDQAHSPMLGLATTKQLKDELAARGPDSPDDYRTFDPDRDPP
jgi:hypothetical protein